MCSERLAVTLPGGDEKPNHVHRVRRRRSLLYNQTEHVADHRARVVGRAQAVTTQFLLTEPVHHRRGHLVQPQTAQRSQGLITQMITVSVNRTQRVNTILNISRVLRELQKTVAELSDRLERLENPRASE